MDKEIRIVLADDHSVVRAGLRALIDAQPDMCVVGEAVDGLELIAQVEAARPDLVVLDLSMPNLNGLEAAQRLRAAAGDLRMLVLSVHEDIAYLRGALEAGVSGYMLKRTAVESLVEAIHVVCSGGVYLDPALSPALTATVIGGAAAGNVASALSDREETVLRLIASGYSNKEIAAQLTLSVKTVETYKARAMEKLHLGGRVELVRYATAKGWLSEP